MNSTLRHSLQIVRRLRETGPVSRFRARVHTWRDRMLEKPAPALVVATCRALARNDATLTAAGVTFYALLSLLPLILGLLSLSSIVLRSKPPKNSRKTFSWSICPEPSRCCPVFSALTLWDAVPPVSSAWSAYSGLPAPCSAASTGLFAALGGHVPTGISWLINCATW